MSEWLGCGDVVGEDGDERGCCLVVSDFAKAFCGGDSGVFRLVGILEYAQQMWDCGLLDACECEDGVMASFTACIAVLKDLDEVRDDGFSDVA